MYDNIMSLLDESGASDAHRLKLIREYREKIAGKTALESAPRQYWDIGLCLDKGIPLHIWRDYSVHDRARITARVYLASMVEVIDNHYREQDEILKKQEKGKKTGGTL